VRGIAFGEAFAYLGSRMLRWLLFGLPPCASTPLAQARCLGLSHVTKGVLAPKEAGHIPPSPLSAALPVPPPRRGGPAPVAALLMYLPEPRVYAAARCLLRDQSSGGGGVGGGKPTPQEKDDSLTYRSAEGETRWWGGGSSTDPGWVVSPPCWGT